MRCWASALLVVVLAGCASPPAPVPVVARPAASPPCTAFVDAWVGHFRANVARLDGQARAVPEQKLLEARQGLARAGVAEGDCEKPFCVVQPEAGGRLDSYCGYRVDDPTGAELYRWVPWTPASR
ncbi:hypothetical protein IB229_03570 [Pseudomonas sp. PDM14]|uniref:hypothetical protein n=1 Tax=Pseudomonas sp. PDM14 TaxID=2769288 RepID=UPI00177C71F7|nr:hypothetical protein [Pseudomonas sp. PDM14]MBD9482037.1 hypothetical protein [Pseudomonas sp. PDM14]